VMSVANGSSPAHRVLAGVAPSLAPLLPAASASPECSLLEFELGALRATKCDEGPSGESSSPDSSSVPSRSVPGRSAPGWQMLPSFAPSRYGQLNNATLAAS